ncbi:hypothetical protein HK096_006304, partial [Nowakowskiella sp. JEL0078]
MSLFTYYIALPTDLVVPNLIIGAISGRLFGLMSNFFKGLLNQSLEDPGVWALLGMAAAWSGTSRLTLTVVLVCLELTGDFDNIPGLLVVTIVSASIGRYLGPSLYHLELENNGVPFLDQSTNHKMLSRTIGSYVVDLNNLFFLRSEESVERIQEALKQTFGSFPVIKEVYIGDKVKIKPIGIVLYDKLEEAIRGISGGKLLRGISDNDIDDLMEKFPVSDLMNCSPTMVREGTSVAKVHKLIRTLGLKTVLVVDDDGCLIGIITRKDLIRLERLLHEEHGHEEHGHEEHGEEHFDLEAHKRNDKEQMELLTFPTHTTHPRLHMSTANSETFPLAKGSANQHFANSDGDLFPKVSLDTATSLHGPVSDNRPLSNSDEHTSVPQHLPAAPAVSAGDGVIDLTADDNTGKPESADSDGLTIPDHDITLDLSVASSSGPVTNFHSQTLSQSEVLPAFILKIKSQQFWQEFSFFSRPLKDYPSVSESDVCFSSNNGGQVMFDKSLTYFIEQVKELFQIENDVVLDFPGLKLSFYESSPLTDNYTPRQIYAFHLSLISHEQSTPDLNLPVKVTLIESQSCFKNRIQYLHSITSHPEEDHSVYEIIEEKEDEHSDIHYNEFSDLQYSENHEGDETIVIEEDTHEEIEVVDDSEDVYYLDDSEDKEGEYD